MLSAARTRRCFFTMLEFTRIITALHTDAAGDGAEESAATRARLKACFPPGAARRMTQLGMLVSAALARVGPGADDAIIHATQFGEGRALESFLESFPAASPTGFQASIHPGAVQQGMIRRAQPVREFFPMAGGAFLPGQALLAAMLSPAARVVLCGGEERGTWLREVGAAGDATFAYALALARVPAMAMKRSAAEDAQGGAGGNPVEENPKSQNPNPKKISDSQISNFRFSNSQISNFKISKSPSPESLSPESPSPESPRPESPRPEFSTNRGADGSGGFYDTGDTGVPPVSPVSHGLAHETPGGARDALGALGRVALTPSDEPATGLAPAEWFALLHGRKNFDGIAAPGWRLRLAWSDA
jgi:hypothetical protein